MSKTSIITVSNEDLVIRCGKLVRKAPFSHIKFLTTCLAALLIIDILFSLKYFGSAVKIRSHFGYFINMISSGDGEFLPSLQAVPIVFFLILDIGIAFLLFKAFDPAPKPTINRLMYVCVLLGCVLLIIALIVIFTVMGDIYGAHESLHDGIVTAMNNYSNNLKYKMQMDHLQIEFQCCGSKKYDEWYEIKWYDTSIDQDSKDVDGHTPFSCCSMKSLFPCIHHNIEITGKAYMYTPEENLSISTRGCYEIIRERKQDVGWGIIGNLAFYMFLQMMTLSGFRFIQTAHFEKSQFLGNKRIYNMWLFGCYTGKVKKEDKPPVPPVPDELKD